MIDCLFIGHNEMQFEAYERSIRSMGTDSGAYRDLNLNFISINRKLYTAPEAFNLFYSDNKIPVDTIGPLSLGNAFSLTIAYLGTYLHRRGLTFDYVNSFQNEKRELAEKLRKNNIRAIAIPTTLYVSAFPILEMMSFIKEHNSTAKIIIGGPFIATQVRVQDEFSTQYLFNTIKADFYINSSQGEAALAGIVHALKHDLPFDGINNIYYRKGSKYAATSVSTEDNRLEENMPDWDLFTDRLNKLVLSRTSISCPFSCAFCGFPQHAGKYQTMSVETVEREMDAIAATGKATCINFIDDTFNIPGERFKKILRMMIRNKYSFKWNCNFRCQFADREMVELMRASGCEGVFLGLESGSPQILKNMNKVATVEKYRAGLALLKEQGIVTYASFIIGFPGETRETVQDTVRFIEECQPDFFRTQAWYCDPFTPIWQEREKYQIKNSQFAWSHATMDARTAFDLIDEIFLTVKNSTWVPQYNFEFLGIFNLLHRGFSLVQVRDFMADFNACIKEKLRTGQKEVSAAALEKLKRTCRREDGIQAEKESAINRYDADFDF